MTLLTNLLRRHARKLFPLIPVAGLLLIFWPPRPLRSDSFIFYLPNASHVITVQTIGQTNYLPLLQLMNMVGKVNGLTVAQDSLKVYFESTELEFHVNNKTIRVTKSKVKLSDPVRVDNGQWMVPVDFLSSVLPQLIHQPVVHRMGSRRVFIGDVKPSSFTVHLEPVTNGSRITVQFTEKVDLRSTSSNGKWVLFLGDKPLLSSEQKFTFQDPYFRSVQFDDQDGVPKLIVTPATEGLNFYSKVDESGRTLEADLVKPSPAIAQLPPPTPVPGTPVIAPGTVPTPPPGAVGNTEVQTGSGLPVVVLDAGHGAEDGGARGGNGVLEKDIVAQLVARVRSALLASKKYRIVLTRLGDVNPSLDQRDITANGAHPLVFLTFHSGNLGVRTSRVVLYTYQSSALLSAEAEEQSRESFIPWSTAQLTHLARSREFAQVLHEELVKISGASVNPPEAAPVRVLRSVNAPAVAVEVGSLAPDVDPSFLTSPDFQGGIADAIVRALDAFEGKS